MPNISDFVKKLISIILIVAMLSACTGTTEYGSCVGLASQEKPSLEYTVSWWNLFVGVFLFSETVLIPVVTILFFVKCPTAKIQPVAPSPDSK
jgi:hypothetical protein